MNDEEKQELARTVALFNRYLNGERGLSLEEAEQQLDAPDMCGWFITSLLKMAHLRGWDADLVWHTAVDDYATWAARRDREGR